MIFIAAVMYYFGIVPEGWYNIVDKYSIETIKGINGCEEMSEHEMDIDGIHVTVYASKHINDAPNEYVKYMVCSSTQSAKKLMKHYEEILYDDHVSGEDYIEGHMTDTLDADVEFYARRSGRMVVMTDAAYQIFYDSEDTVSVDDFNKALKKRYKSAKEFIEKNY